MTVVPRQGVIIKEAKANDENDLQNVPNGISIKPKAPASTTEQNYAEFQNQASKRLNEKQTQVLKNIGECESGFRMVANRSGSSAYGIFQIIKVHSWRGDRYSHKGNIKIAIDLFLEQGTTPWNASKHCWSKK